MTEAPGYHFYEYKVGGNPGSLFQNVDSYLTYVAVCAIDKTENQNPGGKAHPALVIKCPYDNPNTPHEDVCFENYHMGPKVRVTYRAPGETEWREVLVKDFDASGGAWVAPGLPCCRDADSFMPKVVKRQAALVGLVG